MSWRFWPVKLALRHDPTGFIIIDKSGGSLDEFAAVVFLDSPPCPGGLFSLTHCRAQPEHDARRLRGTSLWKKLTDFPCLFD
jgi:hypothetical protein